MLKNFLNFKTGRLAKKIFGTFLIVCVLNLATVPNFVIAEGETSENATETTVSTESVVAETSTLEISQGESASQTQTEEAELDQNTEAQEPQNVLEEEVSEQTNNESEVNTGDAVSSVNVVNEVNTNEVNSEVDIVVVGDSLGDSSLDLRPSLTGGSSASTTSILCNNCTGTTTLTNQNTATVTNVVIANANTGENVASSTASSTGGASIQTGDAYAGANVVNIVNTNIVESDYMLLVFNNFGDWSGDLVLPNQDFFGNFLSLFNPNCNCGSSTNVLNTNNSSIQNNVSGLSNTGGNMSIGGGSISTGDALSSSNVYNLTNTNVYNTSSFYLLVKVFGDWNGNIFNLPEGISWLNTPEGVLLFNQDDENFKDKFLTQNGINTEGSGLNDISNQNEAEVSNNVILEANTGQNQAYSQNSDIKTGDAYTGSNVVNVVNTNIVSSNWFTALVNIFGNWNGNISFGQPDLWIGTVASIEGSAEAGSAVTFTTTIKNNGDARASDINMLARLNTSHFEFAETNSDFHQYQIDELLPGEKKEFQFVGYIDRFASGQNIVIESIVYSAETDSNNQDNEDMLSFVAKSNPGAIIMPQTYFATSYPDLSVEKTYSLPSSILVDGKEIVPNGASVDYEIVIKNSGGSAYDAVLFDELRDEEGEVINAQYWELGEILPEEEITVTYTTEFNQNLPAGTYTNYAWVEAINGESVSGLEKDADSNVASARVLLGEKMTYNMDEPDQDRVEESEGEVLGLFNENIEIIREEINFDYGGDLLLGGFCESNESVKKNVDTFVNSQNVLLSLSFLLIMQKRKLINTNLLLV